MTCPNWKEVQSMLKVHASPNKVIGFGWRIPFLRYVATAPQLLYITSHFNLTVKFIDGDFYIYRPWPFENLSMKDSLLIKSAMIKAPSFMSVL